MRRAFLMLFPGLAAQVMPTKPRVCDANGCREFELVEKRRSPLNGECPGCGRMAPKRAEEVYAMRDGVAAWEPAKNILVRCAYCSNAFYQDAEVVK